MPDNSSADTMKASSNKANGVGEQLDNTGPGSQVMNAKEAAAFVGAHVETVRRLARKGEIPAYKVGKDWRFRKEALSQWIGTQHQHQDAPRILIVDDEQQVRDLVGLILTREGYTVLKAREGREGLALLESASVDLVLLDLKMPVMDGAQFLRHADKKGFDLPVIIITGYPHSDLMKEAMAYGPVMLMTKPLNTKMLLRAVRTQLGGGSDSLSRAVSAR